MLKYFAELPVRKRVGILGILLGIIAIFAPDPYHTTKAGVNVQELATASTKEVNEVCVKEIADWIIKGKTDYRLIDLREKNKYDEYHIPTAECIPVEQLPESDLMRNEKIFLYSDNDLTAAQAWFLLKAMDYKSVCILKGGLENWKSQILYPTLPENATKEQKLEFEKMSEVAKFFGGAPRTGTVAKETKLTVPKIKAPVQISLKRSKKRPKREGC